MTLLTITAKGQITVSKGLLNHLGLRPGEKVEVEALPNGRLSLRAAPRGNIAELFGSLARPGQPTVSIEDMNRTIAEGGAGKR